MSNICYRAAACAFWADDFAAAQTLALRAWQTHRLNIRPVLLAAFTGATGRSLIQRWRGNPYGLRSV
jgi:hypothetical protein